MSEPNNLRWQFRVVELPKPFRDGTRYRLLFLGVGFGVGGLWEFLMTDLLGRRRGSVVVLSVVAVLFIWQSVFLKREERRLAKQTEEIRKWANREIGPEAIDEARGAASHSGE